MAIGFTVPNIPTRKVLPDKTLSRQAAPRVRVAQFGEGYQQRAIDGINNIVDTYSIMFANREKIEADDILAFFESRNYCLPAASFRNHASFSKAELILLRLCSIVPERPISRPR